MSEFPVGMDDSFADTLLKCPVLERIMAILEASSWRLMFLLTSIVPQLHSLRLNRYISLSVLSWLKLHTKELRSLESA